MLHQWTSHLETQEEKDRFKQTVKHSKAALDRALEIVNERLKGIDNIETSVEKYKQPGWDAIQAHYNGEKAALKWVSRLINLDQQDTQNERKPT